MENISSKVARHQLNYYGHVARMAPERMVKKVKIGSNLKVGRDLSGGPNFGGGMGFKNT
jgi:hypothetical protein